MPESPIGVQMVPSPENQDCTPSVSASSFPPTIYLDDNGDLRLRVTAEKEGHSQDFVVCSRALMRLSPVFKVLLSGGFEESRPTEGEWIVALPDDDREALLTLLNIIHGRFGMVPDKPRLEELYRILCVANKYDMTEAVRPWAGNWAKLAEEAQREKTGGNPAMLTFVAWELGRQELYAKIVQKFVGECSIDENGRLTTPKGLCLEDYDHIGPLDLLEKIGESRRTVVQSVLDLFHDFSRTLLDGDHCHQRTTAAKDSIFCDYIIFGSLCRATFKIRGSLLPESADDIAESANCFCSSAQNIINSIICISNHGNCNPAPSLGKKLDEVLVLSQEMIVTASHKRYMKKQRQKTGLHEPLPIQGKGSEGK
ncbi:hypothetical protein BDZ45DRAFT_811387 [Acephala macrosclerotiorum]|nr:hypothetical protein BDZ45DRAFT_811387 [Acephala macrosclerotiorum]